MKLDRQTLMERAGLKEEDEFYDADKEQKNDEEDMPAVALMLEDGYGTHNFDQFLDHLRMQLNTFRSQDK